MSRCFITGNSAAITATKAIRKAGGQPIIARLKAARVEAA